jgi:hypothetical protein
MLNVSAPDTRLELFSEIMAGSFLRYKWKESLMWILHQLMPELELMSAIDDIGDPQRCPIRAVPDTHSFLHFIDKSQAIPIASNPHSVFVFSSLENFVAGVYDTINANWILDGHSAVRHHP